MRSLSIFAVALGVAAAACGPAGDGAYADHDEASDYEDVPPPDGKADLVGVPATFDKNLIVADEVFLDSGAVTGDAIQAFLESTPYHRPSWLANETIAGVRAADYIAQVAQEYGINPVLLLVRMQVEASLIGKSSRPSQYQIDRALGCGCPDGSNCTSTYRGLGPQIECGATVMMKWHDASIDGSGVWRVGRARRTLDGVTVTPRGHATAGLYAYTPWVLTGTGGNWLVWNVTRRYLRYLDDSGLLTR